MRNGCAMAAAQWLRNGCAMVAQCSFTSALVPRGGGGDLAGRSCAVTNTGIITRSCHRLRLSHVQATCFPRFLRLGHSRSLTRRLPCSLAQLSTPRAALCLWPGGAVGRVAGRCRRAVWSGGAAGRCGRAVLVGSCGRATCSGDGVRLCGRAMWSGGVVERHGRAVRSGDSFGHAVGRYG